MQLKLPLSRSAVCPCSLHGRYRPVPITYSAGQYRHRVTVPGDAKPSLPTRGDDPATGAGAAPATASVLSQAGVRRRPGSPGSALHHPAEVLWAAFFLLSLENGGSGQPARDQHRPVSCVTVFHTKAAKHRKMHLMHQSRSFVPRRGRAESAPPCRAASQRHQHARRTGAPTAIGK